MSAEEEARIVDSARSIQLKISIATVGFTAVGAIVAFAIAWGTINARIEETENKFNRVYQSIDKITVKVEDISESVNKIQGYLEAKK